MFVSSIPSGAQVFLDGVNTNQVTPATVETKEGVHDVTLKLAGYADNTFTISVQSGQTSTVSDRQMTVLGSIYVQSVPVGAQIFLNGVNTNQVTPYSIPALFAASYDVKLSLTEHKDSTVTVIVTGGNESQLNVILIPISIKTFGPVRLWETTGTTASQPSGLDLSSGMAYGISSANKVDVDIYYDSNGFLVRSSSNHTNMTRETFFKVGSASNLSDGVDSPAKDATWASSMTDRETNYVFLYDNDGNSSKLKITSYGGGTPDNPAWVEVQWIYNTAVGSKLF
ncbi:MAG: PEGA domain-containing protein [Bacteroidota bacterium]